MYPISHDSFPSGGHWSFHPPTVAGAEGNNSHIRMLDTPLAFDPALGGGATVRFRGLWESGTTPMRSLGTFFYSFVVFSLPNPPWSPLEFGYKALDPRFHFFSHSLPLTAVPLFPSSSILNLSRYFLSPSITIKCHKETVYRRATLP